MQNSPNLGCSASQLPRADTWGLESWTVHGLESVPFSHTDHLQIVNNGFSKDNRTGCGLMGPSPSENKLSSSLVGRVVAGGQLHAAAGEGLCARGVLVGRSLQNVVHLRHGGPLPRVLSRAGIHQICHCLGTLLRHPAHILVENQGVG